MNNKNKVEIFSRLSPDMQNVLNYQLENPPQQESAPAANDYAAIRLAYEKERQFWNQGGPEMAQTLNINVPFNNHLVPTRLYYPKTQQSKSVLFYIHGGGFCVGSINTHDRIMRILAEESQCIVIGIEYTLSPDAKFPQAIKEIVAVVHYFRERADEFFLNKHSIGFTGDSAGAHLSVAAFLWLRDKIHDCQFVKGLVLYYGLYGLKDSRSIRLYGNSWDGLTEEDLAFYRDIYLNDADDENSSYYCFFNNDLTINMPACYIASCEFDPLLDDSEALYAILKDQGVNCEYKMYPGVMHAFLHYSKMMTISYDAITDGAHYFKKLIK